MRFRGNQRVCGLEKAFQSCCPNRSDGLWHSLEIKEELDEMITKRMDRCRYSTL